MLSQITGLEKFKTEFEDDLKPFIEKIEKKISILKDEVAKNHEIADQVLIEIDTLFASSLAKLQSSPQVVAI